MTSNPEDSFEVSFPDAGREAPVRAGATVMDAALLCGVWIDAPCGGGGECGKCLVRVAGEVSPPTAAEEELLGRELLDQGLRLACQATVTGPCRIEPQGEVSWAAGKARLAGRSLLAVDLPSLLSRSFAAPPLGAALDVGTTTLCVSLVDLTTGTRLGVSSAENPQTRFGADVMTRIERCRKDPGALERMHQDVLFSLNGLLDRLASAAGRPVETVERLVMVGNTTMLHLALGEDPSPLGSYPFKPRISGPVDINASEAGVAASSGARLLAPPVLSGFLGADILAVILASGIADRGKNSLVVDLGTNGEIALGGRGRVVACSAAAGPAFEGAQVSSGMRAVPGAIESFSRDGLLTPHVLGGGVPRGICGSGLLDAVAALLDAGLLSGSGRLSPAQAAQPHAPGRIRETGSGREFLLAPGTEITLTQEDVRQVQLAKGAIGAGIQVLCSLADLRYEQVEQVELAGVFGSLLRPGSAVKVGLLPREMGGRIHSAGNAALTGAEMVLASETRWDKACEMAGAVEVVELSGYHRFEKAFIENLSFQGVTSP